MKKRMIETQTKKWLECLCEKFNVGDSPIVDTAKCMSKIDEFICIIYKSYPKKHIFTA